MNKEKARNHTTGKQINSLMDDVKSDYKDVEGKTLEAVSSAKDSVVTWVEEGVSNIKEGTHQLMDDAKETYDKATKSIDKNVKHGMKQYNVKAQEFADKVPGGFGDTVDKYPWVAITVGLLIGITLGFFLKPSRRA